MPRRFAGLRVLLVLAALFSPRAPAQDRVPSEYQVKAAFLYNFARFVTWPPGAFASPHSPIVVGVLGKDPFGSDLDSTIEPHPLNGHPFVVKRFTDVAKARGCHLLFISSSERSRLESVLKSLKGLSILTVAEMKGFAEHGGMIELIEVSGRIRFEINNGAARRARLKVSSQLLNLATKVYGFPRPDAPRPSSP